MEKFKFGDRVKSAKNDKSLGLVGVVIGENSKNVVLVNFGPDFDGHNGGGHADSVQPPVRYQDLHNWYVNAEYLILLSSAPKTTESITTKGETKMNLDFNKLGKEIVSDNIQFAKFEAERKLGQAALDVSIEAFCKQFPSFRQTADTNIGKLTIANIVRVLGNQYKGANKEAVDMFTSAVMRGGYASAGDSIDLEKMFDGLVDKFKSIIPTQLVSGTSETSEQ
jgi:hypothetical protein